MKKTFVLLLLSSVSFSELASDRIAEYAGKLKGSRLHGNTNHHLAETINDLISCKTSKLSNNYASSADRVKILGALFQNEILGKNTDRAIVDGQESSTKNHYAALRITQEGIAQLYADPTLGAKRKIFIQYMSKQQNLFTPLNHKDAYLNLLTENTLKVLFPKEFFHNIAHYGFGFTDYLKQNEMRLALAIHGKELAAPLFILENNAISINFKHTQGTQCITETVTYRNKDPQHTDVFFKAVNGQKIPGYQSVTNGYYEVLELIKQEKKKPQEEKKKKKEKKEGKFQPQLNPKDQPQPAKEHNDEKHMSDFEKLRAQLDREFVRPGGTVGGYERKPLNIGDKKPVKKWADPAKKPAAVKQPANIPEHIEHPEPQKEFELELLGEKIKKAIVAPAPEIDHEKINRQLNVLADVFVKDLLADYSKNKKQENITNKIKEKFGDTEYFLVNKEKKAWINVLSLDYDQKIFKEKCLEVLDALKSESKNIVRMILQNQFAKKPLNDAGRFQQSQNKIQQFAEKHAEKKINKIVIPQHLQAKINEKQEEALQRVEETLVFLNQELENNVDKQILQEQLKIAEKTLEEAQRKYQDMKSNIFFTRESIEEAHTRFQLFAQFLPLTHARDEDEAYLGALYSFPQDLNELLNPHHHSLNVLQGKDQEIMIELI